MDRYTYDTDKDLKVLGCAADYLTFGQGSVKCGTVYMSLMYFFTCY